MPGAKADNNIIPIISARVELKHDGPVTIATGRSRHETRWKNNELRWSDLLTKFKITTRTRETYDQYCKMSKTEQSDIKDVGGFVGGQLRQGRRKGGSLLQRSLLTLDADFAEPDFPELIGMLSGYAYAIYTTHKHCPEAPRWRYVIPLKRPVTPDEGEAIGRFIAADIGIDLWDDSTYQPERLMYWPSTAEDGEYRFEYADAPWLDPDAILREHPFWRDVTTWPESSRATHMRRKMGERQGDPREKPGVIGAFNRAYTISTAIATFLSDVYTECDVTNRYTYTAGSTAAGLVVYDDDLFAFSNHGTDPAGGQLCNAFDLVRLHRFGELDDDTGPETPITQRPSYHEMCRFALKDGDTKIELASTRLDEAREDFEVDNTWKRGLQYNDKGTMVKTINNAMLIIENDQYLKDNIGYDAFTRRLMATGALPWRQQPGPWTDADDSALRHYVEYNYGLKAKEDIVDALAITAAQKTYHPVLEYLDSLTWDGTPRIETLLIDLMGAADTAYTRGVTRKWLTAAVARVRNPGCKFDTMLILVGNQGIGKSQFFSRLAHNPAWFSDSIAHFDNTKDVMEQLAGKWIIEIGELSAMRKAEVESVKTFLSKQSDAYRPPYGHRQEEYPRQCVFGGTTNRDDFLQDATGGRRFWPVPVSDARRMWAEMTRDMVDQIWAEADAAYALGEEIYITGDAARQAVEMQDQFTESGGKLGMAELYLERWLPAGWDELPSADRINWLRGYDFEAHPEGDHVRDKVTGVELFVECFGGQPEQYRLVDAREMTDILFRLGWRKTGERPYVVDYGRQRLFRRERDSGTI